MRTDATRNRSQILDAARVLVAEHGTAITMHGLAARAGVAVGTVYRHFATKDDLLAAVVEESVERIAERAEGALARARAGGSAWDELTDFWSGLAEGPHAGRSTRLAAASLGIGLRDERPPGSQPTENAGRALVALTGLLDLTREAGDMRDDVRLGDLFLLLAQAPERDEPDLRERYFELVSAGLRRTAVDDSEDDGAADGGADGPG